MALPKIVQEIMNQVSAVDSNGDTMAGKLTINKVIQSNAVASDVSLSRIPSEGEIALQTGNGDGGRSAWIWRENYSSSNWGIFHDNSSDVLHIVGSSTSRFSVKLGDGTVTIPGNLIVNGTITGNMNYLPLSGGTLTGQLKLKGDTVNGNSIYQFNNGTYRNPGNHTPEVIIRADNSTTGIFGYRPGLVIYNSYGDQYITAGLSFASRETTSAGNAVMLGAIVGIKESAGTDNAWSQGGLRFLTKNMGALTQAMTINSSGNIGIGSTAPTFKLQVEGISYTKGMYTCNRGISTSTDGYTQSALEIREYGFGGAQTDTWGYAPRLSFHWAGRVAAQIGLASNGMLYINNNASGSTTFQKIWVQGDAVTGAVWNDYAEYRQGDTIDPGYCLIEVGDDTLIKSTERMQSWAGISSDTWGFAQGETEKAKTPIAVAGRVLAYPYQNRNNYKPGDCVCTAPEGKVDIMTDEEIYKHPDKIIGVVSCVPDYEEWGGGELADRPPVKVNGRIWIRVK